MPKSLSRVAAVLLNEPWGILPQWLQEMYAILLAHHGDLSAVSNLEGAFARGLPEKTEDETETEEKPAEEVEELVWNGETKKVTKAEMRELAQKGFDYTQKTQILAEERHRAEAQIKAAQESVALQHQQIDVISQVKAIDAQLAQFKDVNWHQLAEQDPVRYLQLNQSFRDLKDQREGKVQEFQQKAQALQQTTENQRKEVFAREAKALAAIPEFSGAQGQENRTRVKAFLNDEGYTDAEIDSVIDHRAFKIALKAAQWDKLQKSGVQVQKKVAEVPKVVKAGSNKPQTRSADKSKDTYAKLKSTGRGEYAAKLIEQMI